MKLSEVLDRYYVFNVDNMGLVGFPDAEGRIQVELIDSDDGGTYTYYFKDQEVKPYGKAGGFTALSEDGVGFAFLALEGADLGGEL